jgi:DNA-binding protein HU-beta
LHRGGVQIFLNQNAPWDNYCYGVFYRHKLVVWRRADSRAWAVGVLSKYWLAGRSLFGRATGKRLRMSKAFIASVIQGSAEITGVAANRAAADLIEAIVKDLKKNGKFTLPSFGTFTVRKTKARKGVNPRTGAEIKVKAGKTVRFKASPSLKKLV